MEREWKIREVDEILSGQEQRFINAVVGYLQEFHSAFGSWPHQDDIIARLKAEGFPYHLSRQWLARWEGKYWKKDKDPSIPRGYVYSPIFSGGTEGLHEEASRNFENLKNLKIYKNVKQTEGEGADRRFEELKNCRNDRDEGAEGFAEVRSSGDGTAEAENFNSSNFSNFQDSRTSREDAAGAESERPVGIRSDFPSKEEQPRMVEDYFRTHNKAPYQEEQEKRRTADCRKCKHYDAEREVCPQYFGQPIVPSLSAKHCPLYETGKKNGKSIPGDAVKAANTTGQQTELFSG